MVTTAESLQTSGALVGASVQVNSGGYTTPITRAELIQEDLAKYDLLLENFFTHDAPATKLPGTATTDDFGLTSATAGTTALYLTTIDEKANGGAHPVYGRTTYRLPPEYVAAQTLQVVLAAGAKTTIADTAMTVDVEVWKVHATDGTLGSDLVTTAAQTCNSVTIAAKTFTINAAGLSPGDKLEIRVAISTNDAATGTAVLGTIYNAYLVMDIKG